MNTNRLKKSIIKALPYVLMGLVCTNLGEAWRLAEGADASKKLRDLYRAEIQSLNPPELTAK